MSDLGGRAAGREGAGEGTRDGKAERHRGCDSRFIVHIVTNDSDSTKKLNQVLDLVVKDHGFRLGF